jgi:hypothetical protein
VGRRSEGESNAAQCHGVGDWPAGGLEQGRNIGFNGGAGKVDNGIKTTGGAPVPSWPWGKRYAAKSEEASCFKMVEARRRCQEKPMPRGRSLARLARSF